MWYKITSSVKSITKKSKSSFYYSFQILPVEKRDAIYSVYSFCRITDDIVDSLAPEEKKRESLLSWENELKQSLKIGSSKNKVLNSLVKTIKNYNIPENYFFELISGARMDLEGTNYKTFDDLYKYCYKVASVVGFMSVHIFGFEKDETLQYAEKLGIAFQLTNIIRDVGKDADIKRIYLPEEDLIKFSVEMHEILNKNYSEKIKNLLQFEYERAVNYYNQAAELLPEADKKNMLPSQIMNKTYFKLLQKIKRNNFNVFEEEIKVGEFHKKRIALFLFFRNLLRFS